LKADVQQNSFAISLEFCKQLIEKATEFGEKYDQNLVYLSNLALTVGEKKEVLT
jgi:hypothetical protein